MAVVYSKVLLFDPPLIYTAPDTCVFGAVGVCSKGHLHFKIHLNTFLCWILTNMSISNDNKSLDK